MGAVRDGALILGALGCGAMAGIYAAFSGFIMRALDATGATAATQAMVSINRVILQSGFMALFFGSSLLCGGLLVAALVARPPGHAVILAGATIYLIGMLGLTILRNVPLNNMLAARGAEFWPTYLRDWTFWNHLRTAASALAAAAFGLALAA